MTADREKQLLERIRQLEELNSALQDKLDLIYEIVAPADEDSGDPESAESGLVNITPPES